MYDDHLRLVGKHVEDFLLVLIELFSLGRTAEALEAIIGSKSAISLQWGLVDPKFQVEWVALTNHSSSQKTRLNVLSYGIKIWIDFSSVLSQFTRLTDGQTDRQTDGHTDRILIARPSLHSMQCSKNLKKLSASDITGLLIKDIHILFVQQHGINTEYIEFTNCAMHVNSGKCS